MSEMEKQNKQQQQEEKLCTNKECNSKPEKL